MSSEPVRFVIPGVPVAKGRPRFSNAGKFVRTYTPSKTRKFEQDCAVFGQRAMKGRELLQGALILSLDVFLLPPKSWSKTRTADAIEGRIAATKRPDLDNYQKAIQDALDGIVWADDSQIVTITARKSYASTPGIYVCVVEQTDTRVAP